MPNSVSKGHFLPLLCGTWKYYGHRRKLICYARRFLQETLRYFTSILTRSDAWMAYPKHVQIYHDDSPSLFAPLIARCAFRFGSGKRFIKMLFASLLFIFIYRFLHVFFFLVFCMIYGSLQMMELIWLARHRFSSLFKERSVELLTISHVS